MKAKINREFKPVTIELTFETQNELDIYGALFNIYEITDPIDKLTNTKPELFQTFKDAGADVSKHYNELIDAISIRFE